MPRRSRTLTERQLEKLEILRLNLGTNRAPLIAAELARRMRGYGLRVYKGQTLAELDELANTVFTRYDIWQHETRYNFNLRPEADLTTSARYLVLETPSQQQSLRMTVPLSVREHSLAERPLYYAQLNAQSKQVVTCSLTSHEHPISGSARLRVGEHRPPLFCPAGCQVRTLDPEQLNRVIRQPHSIDNVWDQLINTWPFGQATPLWEQT